LDVLNTDHCTAGTHLTSFLQAVNEARRQGVNVALSKPCFELWLLLHHLDAAAVTGLADAHAVIQALRTTLGQYNKTQLRKSDYPLTFVIEACQRAKDWTQSLEAESFPLVTQAAYICFGKRSLPKLYRRSFPRNSEFYCQLEPPPE